MFMADTRDLHAVRQRPDKVAERANTCGKPFDRDFRHVELCWLRREDWFDPSCEEIEAKNWPDHPEWIGDGVANRRIFVAGDVERRLECGVLVIDPANIPSV